MLTFSLIFLFYIIQRYARHGYRIIAMGYKELDASFNIVKIDKTPRDIFESELTFLGLVILENKLKPETAKIIHVLTRSNIRTIMCTGDNLLTGISVAHECGMLNRPRVHHHHHNSHHHHHSNELFKVKKKSTKIWSKSADARIVTIEANSHDPSEKPRFILAGDDSDVELADFTSLETLLANEKSDADGGEIHLAINGGSFEIIRKFYPNIFDVLMKYGLEEKKFNSLFNLKIH